MQVTLEVPEDLARLLGGNGAGLTRYEMDGFLKAHGLLLSQCADDLKLDAETALAFRNK